MALFYLFLVIFFGFFNTLPAAVVDQCVHPCLFYVNGTHISRRGNIFNPTFSDATEFEVPFGLSQNVKTLDYHFKYKRIYWYTPNQVYLSGFEPRAAIKSLKLQVGEISGLTVDWQYELLYWTDRVYRLIGVSGLNGEHQSVIYREFTDTEFPTHVAVIGEQGLIFSVWRNSNTGYHVRKTSLITSITETEYTGYNSVVISLVINRRQNKIYIAETSGQIISFDYSGNNKKSMTFDGISGLVITYKGATSQLYVLKSDKKLFMLRDIPEKPQEVLTFNVGSVSTSDLLVIYHNESQIDRTIVTKCPSQICSHLCLYAMPGGHVCTCPIGWQLKTDRVTCEKVNSVAAIVAKEKDKLRMTELYSGDTGEYKRKDLYFSDLVEGVKIDVHDMVATETDLIFIDRTNSWLLKVNMETKKITLLSSRFEYTSGTHLQYDHISNLLYLTCCNNKGVMVANLKGEVKHILETTDYDIIDMVVSSQHAFFVTLEKKSTNYQCSLYKLDGTKVKLYSAGPNMISHIAYDYTKNRIFWHDSHTKTITYYIHSTNVKNVYVNNIHKLNMMAVQGDKLLWMTDNKYLYMVSLTEANPSSSQSLIMVYDAPVEIPVSINAPLTASSHPCFVNNGNCSHLCLRTNNKAYKCDCPEDMKIDATNIKQCAFITTTQTAHACEHQASKELKCEDGHYLHITHAMYGRLRADICINTLSRNCVAASSLTVVRSKCQHKQTCTVTATNTWFGDPCENVVKYLEVRYQCIRNKAQATICPSPCLYYSQETKIIRVSLNKTGIGLNGDAHLVFDLGKQIKSFDVHYNKELLFWSDSNKIYRSKVTGENIEILNDNGIVNPNGIAVDYVNDVIYWTDRTLDTVSVMSINGFESLILHSNTDKVKSPTSIVMDIGYDGGLLFWINDKTPTPSIGSSKLSGTNLKSYKMSSLSSPQDLHVDVVGKNLYWISIKGVEQMSYTGGNKETFTAASGLSIENSFTILGTQGLFYRTLQKAVSVQRFKPSTVNENNIPISGMTADAKIKAVVTPPSLTSSCTNKNCINGLCLNGGVCTCKRGYKLVNKQCSPSNPTHEFLLLKNGRFHHQKLYANGLEDTMILISDFVGKNFNPVSFDVDWKQSYLYWYDQTLHSIMQMSLGDKDIKVVVKIPSYIFTVSNIRYEHLQDVIYWIEDGGVYKCSARNGSMLVAVYDKGLLPRSHLQLASREGFIFFVETNSSSKLTTIHHGTFSQYVEEIMYRAYMPIDMLTVDQFGSRLYWITAHELKSCNFDGSNVITIISQTTFVPKTKLFVESGDLLDDVFGLQVDEINVFWFASNKNSYYKADKLTASPFSVVYGIDVSGNETGILQLEMKKQEVIDKKILLHNYTYSYSTADSLCSTSSTCGYGTAPADPPNCPLGYISKQISEEVCGTCDEAVGISFVCQCNDWMTCNHRWSSSVTCPYQSPYLRMKARKCLKTIKSGFCSSYKCQPNEATDNKCLSDDDCAETSNKCCLTYCGRRCLKKSAANTSPCEVNNDGCSHVCVTTEYNHAVCQCPYNMEINEDATTCKYTAGYCSENPCFGSTCVDRIDSYECICNGFLYGDHCEHGFCISSPCQNGATCGEYYGGYTCTCVAGYNGDNCENIDHCYENECEGNSTCIAGTNPYSCKCDAFHSGTHCENLSYCAILPCLHGGSCTDTATGYQCQCERDYVGTTCADLHPCFKLPCLNGGKCAFKGDSYQCLCEGYYAGDNCDIFYGDNIASTTLKETAGKQVTAQTFKETMALVYTEFCATNDCTTGAVFPSRTRRATEKLEFKPRHIIVVVGYPKVVGQGEVQILYSVLMPVDEAKQAGLINVEDVVKGMESSSSIIENKLGANVVKTSKYVQPEAAKTDDGNQIVLIGAAAGGGVVVLIVLIITIGCCVVKRKGNRDKDVHIMMTNPLGGTSVYHGKLHNSARPSIDSRYTQSTEFGFPSTTRSTIGAAPPPPDYPRGAHADGGVLYEGIDDYNAKHNEVFYLESEELKTNVNNKMAENPYTGLGQNTEKKYDSNYMGLKFPDQNETYVTPNAQQRDENYRLSEKFLAAEREKSFSSSGNYTADDYAMYDDSYDGKDDYLPLQNS